MNHVFEKAMTFVARWEWRNRVDGAPTDDPKDPGGYTKYGMAQRYHPDIIVRDLTLPEALNIYWKEYWQPLQPDNLSWQMAIAAMDSAVNCGVSRAKAWVKDSKTARELIEKRMAFHLSKKNPRFEKGWINRCNDLKKYLDILEQNDGMA